MTAHFELETIWAARLRVVRVILHGHESRITALETRNLPRPGSPPSSINWRRLLKPIKASFGAISFLVRHWGILSAAAVAIWIAVLPTLKWIWRFIVGFVGYVIGAGSGV